MPDDFDVKAVSEAGQIAVLTKQRDVQEVSVGNVGSLAAIFHLLC